MKAHRRGGLVPATGALQSILQSQELAKALRPHFAKVIWAEVVGPQVAEVTQVERVQNGNELVVRVKNSVWANELALLKGEMLRGLNSALGGPVLVDIRFKASGLSRKKPAPPTTDIFLTPVPSDSDLAQVILPPAVSARIEETVSRIERESLRERIRISLIRAARAEQWKRDHGWQPCARCGGLTYPTPLAEEILLCSLCHAGAI